MLRNTAHSTAFAVVIAFSTACGGDSDQSDKAAPITQPTAPVVKTPDAQTQVTEDPIVELSPGEKYGYNPENLFHGVLANIAFYNPASVSSQAGGILYAILPDKRIVARRFIPADEYSEAMQIPIRVFDFEQNTWTELTRENDGTITESAPNSLETYHDPNEIRFIIMKAEQTLAGLGDTNGFSSEDFVRIKKMFEFFHGLELPDKQLDPGPVY